MVVEVASIDEVELSPDGAWVTYVVTRYSVDKNQPFTERVLQHVPRHDSAAAAPVQLPRGASAVRWCPDGRCLSMLLPSETPSSSQAPTFIRFDIATEQTTPIHIHDTDPWAGQPGARRRVTAVPGNYVWSPRGHYLAFTAPVGPPAALDPRRGVPKDKYSLSGRGSSPSYQGLFLAEVATGAVTQLTPDSLHVVSGLSWAPDERALAVAVAPDPDGYPNLRTDLVAVDRATGAVRALVTRPGLDAGPAWSPDGRWIAFGTADGMVNNTGGRWPALVSAAGGEARTLRTQGETPACCSAGIWWAPDGRTFLYGTTHELVNRLARADVASGSIVLPPQPAGLVLPTDRHHRFSADRRLMVYTRQALNTPPELFVTAVDGTGRPVGASRQLTNVNAPFAASALVRGDDVSWPGPDGTSTLRGLLLTPTAAWRGERVAAPLPTIVSFSGLVSEFNPHWFSLALRGYAVFIPKLVRRGGYSEGYPRELATGPDGLQIPLSGLDALGRRGFTDPDRLGAFGWSLGGYLAAYALTQTARFKAAVLHEPVGLEMLVQTATTIPGSGRALQYRDEFGFTNPFDPAERTRIIAASPMLNTDKVKTPTLLAYGAASLGQEGLQFFDALRRFDVPSAFFLYDEGHGFDRPAAAADFVTREHEWFDHWLRGWPYPDRARAAEYDRWQTH